jgi:hypothetical protein
VRGVLKVNEMLCEIGLALAFVPLEKHFDGPRRGALCTMCTYTREDCQGGAAKSST